MCVVTVTFQIHPEQIDAFLPLIIDNARVSRQSEAGCQLFDICRDMNEVFLYEVYDDRAAFDTHLGSKHFKAFDAAIQHMVVDKHIRLFDEVIR